jgi:hypothetical protein
MTMHKTAAFVAAFLLTASLCIAAGYYRELLALPRVAASAAPAALTPSVLLHFDEASGATSISDSGKYGLTVTSANSARTTNNPAKAGFGNSCDVNANQRRFDIAAHPDFRPGSSNWSFESWIYLSSANAATNVLRVFWGGGTSSLTRSTCYVYKENGAPGTINVATSTNGISVNTAKFSYDPAIWTTQWVHLVVYKLGNQLRAAVNGNQITTWTTANTNLTDYIYSGPSSLFQYGGPSGLNGVNGDEFRYCVGDAMPYGTTNFAPPTAAYTGYE